MQIDRYQYKYRPGYGSDNLLIEFFTKTEGDILLQDILNTIKKINPRLEAIQDLWMNDEILLEFKSDIGEFTFSKDIWGFAFIMTENDQECLKEINAMLSADPLFEKMEFNPDEYKI
jgi:hypothetical protein